MYLDPGDNQFVFFRRQVSRQHDTIFDCVNRYLSLVVRVDVRNAMFVRIVKEHPNQDAVKNRYGWHDIYLSLLSEYPDSDEAPTPHLGILYSLFQAAFEFDIALNLFHLEPVDKPLDFYVRESAVSMKFESVRFPCSAST
uniref:Uncharacterized protein n=1 Tax=Candidatus Kentrum sp. MB TaxID=2138164 RepID=A0A450Y2A6_9GAMM|nr:MAG: hypothetical protein BECKMB1821G_GA0114241_11307 [Candidatus Kentron sp. MB]VFK35673.1 MAG: hypothetical protein BECKMB1821I_GA0114274_11367 [Candidatus Kentron sp. MB]VFK77429.1 MAG: hypothetical protein BECKMB1821H_GA0114242_11377 [Candidatus Kentron sp. MB]